MSLALYLLGLLVFLVGVVWAAVIAGVPLEYILIGTTILLGVGLLPAFRPGRDERKQL
jgi:hypothetical protein